jgi:3alpha(or 20beta)-hydroxysteroid dehydrogenase
MPRLAGRVALITGGAGGIGSATARMFVAEGAQVVLADVAVERATAVAADLGPAATATPLDVREPDQWSAAVQTALAHFGRLDVLVNNAGVWRIGTIADVALEDVRLCFEVNQLGPLLGMRAAAPALRESGEGAIVNISSGAGMAGFPGQIAYSAKKWALRGMTKTAAIEFGGPRGIRVNSVHPGAVATEMIAAVAAHNEHAFDRNPVPRVAQPEEIAALVTYLASTESAYVTGAEFVIDGGLLAGPALFDPNDV